MRRPAQHHPTAWLHPYTGLPGIAVFYNDGGSPQNPPVPTPADLARQQQPTPPTPSTPPAPAPASPADDEDKATFTQRRLNVLMKAEKEEGRRAALRSVAEAAGLDPDSVDPDQLGKLLKDAQAARQAQLTEAQRKEEDLTRQEQELQSGKHSLEEARAELAAQRRTMAREQALIRLGAIDATDEHGTVTAPNLQDALALLERGLAATPDADPAAVAAAADELKKRHPGLFGGAPAPQTLPPAPSGGPAAGNLPQQPNPGKNAIQEAARSRALAMGLRTAS